jgi:hypothetical protein
MTTKKRLILISTLLLAIAVTLGVFAMLPAGPGVTKANFDRIHEGMTKAEVEKIFGREGKEGARSGVETSFLWAADDGRWSTNIWFANNCVTEKHWHNSDEPIFKRIRRLLHLQ